jgi:DNA-binding MarR family transcriptional regulator
MARATNATTGRADADLERDASDLLHAVTDLVRVYQFRDRNRICCHDVSVSQCYALQSIARRESPTLNELAAALYLDKSTASRVVDGLERKGYVRRTAHPEDGRSVCLEATAKGRQLLARIENDLLAEQKKLLADFPADVRRATVDLVSRLARVTASRVAGSCGTGARA